MDDLMKSRLEIEFNVFICTHIDPAAPESLASAAAPLAIAKCPVLQHTASRGGDLTKKADGCR